MTQLENIESIEKRLWKGADTLRANSNLASNEYFMPVMGLIFLRHAYSRFLKVKSEIEASLPSRGGQIRPVTKEDFSGRSAIFLPQEAQFVELVNSPNDGKLAEKIFNAMQLIENESPILEGVLPKNDFNRIDDNILRDLLNTFNDPALEKTDGDIFGRIYEYFLTEFANQNAHDGGEFFTPVSLVQMIVNVIEPNHGAILDPACGSGGMFVQSAHFTQQMTDSPLKQLTFYGQEKNPTTIRLAKMNLAVHGLEGNIAEGITYKDQVPEMVGKADFVMANPPFNVDEVDAEAIKKDPRLPFGLPGINKNKKVPNANYLWMSYFYSYLNEKGRAGFVMSSQASSAGNEEKTVRQKMIETGHIDAMISIRSNFFYTRSVPCELWFFNKAKTEEQLDKVLMIDARNVYRKVTRKIYDFSPEQLKNLTSIVWLYRGETGKFLKLLESHINKSMTEAIESKQNLSDYKIKLQELIDKINPFLASQKEGSHKETQAELTQAKDVFIADIEKYKQSIDALNQEWQETSKNNKSLYSIAQKLAPVTEQSKDLIKQVDLLYKLCETLIRTCENELNVKDSDKWTGKDIRKLIKELDEQRKLAVEQLKLPRYFYKQAHWLQERFPEAKLRDIEGLVKVVSRKDIEDNDYSLTPGRYVGVAAEEVDEDFDFEETLKDIHIELSGLNEEAVQLAAQIAKNFEELGV
jgi:type I restriction enzyme M protein